MSMLALNEISPDAIKSEPYPYLVIPQFIKSPHLATILKEFPNIQEGGSFPLSAVTISGSLANLVAELNSTEFRQTIERAFAIDLTDRPSMITLRGYSREKDGKIHADSKSKLITVLIYLNESWASADGKLRILRDSHDINNYVEEVTPAAGTALIFKVTPNCWHGYTPVVGPRRSLQFNYVIDEAEANKHLSRHTWSARIKRFFRKEDY